MYSTQFGKTVIWLVVSALALVVISSCTQAEPTLTPSPTQKPTHSPTPRPQPKRLALPFSWEELGFRITIIDLAVVPEGEHHGILLEGKKQLVDRIRYKNLLSETNNIDSRNGGIGLDRFRLRTAAGNIYDSRFVGGTPIYGRFYPKEGVTTESYVFDIRSDERPAELWGYDCLKVGPGGYCGDPQLKLLYIFDLSS